MKYFIHRLLCKGKFLQIETLYRPYKKDDLQGDEYEITTHVIQCDTCGQIIKHTSLGKSIS